MSVTQELVDNVVAAGGTLVVPAKSWRDPDSVDYRRRARLAEQHGKVPVGKLLAIRNLPDGKLRPALLLAGGVCVPPTHENRSVKASADLLRDLVLPQLLPQLLPQGRFRAFRAVPRNAESRFTSGFP